MYGEQNIYGLKNKCNRQFSGAAWVLKFEAAIFQFVLISMFACKWKVLLNKLHRQETPNSMGGRKSMCQKHANGSYGTVTDEVRHYGSCSKNSHTSTNAEDLQGLNARTCSGAFQQDLHKIFSQGPAPDHVMTPRGLHQGLFKSVSQGPVEDHAKARGH